MLVCSSSPPLSVQRFFKADAGLLMPFASLFATLPTIDPALKRNLNRCSRLVDNCCSKPSKIQAFCLRANLTATTYNSITSRLPVLLFARMLYGVLHRFLFLSRWAKPRLSHCVHPCCQSLLANKKMKGIYNLLAQDFSVWSAPINSFVIQFFFL